MKISEFEKLKTYTEKLQWLVDKFGDGIGKMPVSNITVYISLCPPNELKETAQYNQWLLDQYLKNNPFCNLEYMQKRYFEIITNNPRAIEYTEQKINEIKNKLEKGENFTQNTKVSFLSYYYGYKSVVGKNPVIIFQSKWDEFSLIVSSYANGVASAYFLTFLETQLKQLEQEGQLPFPVTSPLKPQNFAELFTDKEWSKYVDALTECTPPLLKKEKNKYKFIGNKKTQRGCVASWFKGLKIKGIIDQSINRDELARVLNNEILDYSINGSSIDNESELYKKQFETQLKQLIR